MTKVVFHLKVIRSLCSHIWSSPVNVNGLGFQLCPLFLFFEKEKVDGRTYMDTE